METTTMYAASGWQNVEEHHQRRMPIKIRRIEVPTEHAICVMDFTHAREFTVEQLVAALEEKTGVSGLRYVIQED